MGQKQIKIATQCHLLTFKLLQNSQISITANARDEKGFQKIQYHQQYLFSQFPQTFRNQFQSTKQFYKVLQDSSGVCCGNRPSLYRFEFDEGKFIIRKGSKSIVVMVQKVQKSNITANTIEFDQRISLQERLQKQISQNKSQMLFQKKPLQITSKREQFDLQSCLIKTQKGLMLNLFQKNINENSISKISKFDTTLIQEIDLIGNNLSSQAFKQFIKLDWKNVRNLWADDNLIQKIKGLQRLENLSFLSISQNLLSLAAAQELSKIMLPKLQFFKISFLTQKNSKCWQKLLSNNLINFPSLRRFVVVSNTFLEQKTIKQFQKWKGLDSSRQVIYSINQHMKNLNFKEQQNSTKINSLSNYPQF